MAVLEQITKGITSGREIFANVMEKAGVGTDGKTDGTLSQNATGAFHSQLALGDNVDYMLQLISEGYSGKFNLIYIDPPFFTKSKFNATVTVADEAGSKHRIRHLVFDDRFERSLECYIENLTVRILLMRELLASDGLLWIHLDWHSSHYVKLVLDELMGEKNFVNEVIWHYKSGGSGKKHFSRKHDTLLVYSKTKNYYIDIPQEKSYNRGFKPYNFKGVKEYSDEKGWYTLVNMKDVWSVDMVGRTSAERNGYATQKPMELMKRIILAASREGDLVGDFFCGSGSFLEAANELGRRWAGCDNEKLAISMARKRLIHCKADFDYKCLQEDSVLAGRAVIRVASAEPLENGRKLLRCRLAEFKPEIDTGYIQLNDRKYIEAALENDTLQLVDYVLVCKTTEASGSRADGADSLNRGALSRDASGHGAVGASGDANGEVGTSGHGAVGASGHGANAGRFSADIEGILEGGFDDMTIMSDDGTAIIVVDIFGREYLAEIV